MGGASAVVRLASAEQVLRHLLATGVVAGVVSADAGGHLGSDRRAGVGFSGGSDGSAPEEELIGVAPFHGRQ